MSKRILVVSVLAIDIWKLSPDCRHDTGWDDFALTLSQLVPRKEHEPSVGEVSHLTEQASDKISSSAYDECITCSDVNKTTGLEVKARGLEAEAMVTGHEAKTRAEAIDLEAKAEATIYWPRGQVKAKA